MDGRNCRKEEKQNRNRIFISIVSSIFLHIFLLFFIPCFYKERIPVSHVSVMTVRLVEEDLIATEAKTEKESKAAAKRADKRVDENKKEIKAGQKLKSEDRRQQESFQERKEGKLEKQALLEEVLEEENKEEVDIIHEINERRMEEKRAAEEKFFQAESNKEKMDEVELPQIASLGEFLEKRMEESSEQQGNADRKEELSTNMAVVDEVNGINWEEKGGHRKLLRKVPIELPEEIEKAGLKFIVVMDFTVIPDGHIVNIAVRKSSGNSLWDEIIKKQFAKWIFQAQEGKTSFGTLSISIDY